MNRRDHREAGRFFAVLFLLAFVYIGALSAALEGWTRTYLALSWLGITVLVIATIYSIVTMFTTRRDT